MSPVGDAPPPDAAVEIWQCDALGRYSAVPPRRAGETFLRGSQPTDGAGMVEFRTIYPGWYPGRTVHIHLMVHTGDATLTSQLYFPDDLTDEVHTGAPYDDHPDRDTRNDTDTILPTGGEPAMLDVVPVGDGYRAAVRLVLPGAG